MGKAARKKRQESDAREREHSGVTNREIRRRGSVTRQDHRGTVRTKITRDSGAEGRSAAGAPRPNLAPLPPTTTTPAPWQYANTASAPESNDPLTLVALTRVELEMAREAAQEAVDTAREQGIGWAAIAEVYEVTTQAAQQRFGRKSRDR